MKLKRPKLPQVDWSVPNIAKAVISGCVVGVTLAFLQGRVSVTVLITCIAAFVAVTYFTATAHRHVTGKKVDTWNPGTLHITTMTSSEPVELGTEFSIQTLKPVVVQVVECNKVDGYYVLVCEEVRNWG